MLSSQPNIYKFETNVTKYLEILQFGVQNSINLF